MTESNANGRVFRFGIFETDLEIPELRRQGRRVKLHGQPFQVLRLLLENAGRVVTREELRAELWKEDTFVDFDHGLNEAVNKLRAALSDSASNSRFVETIPRRGYRFIAPVQRVPPAALPVAAGLATGRRLALLGILGLAALVCLALVWGATRPSSIGSDAARPIRSIAVLPLVNLSGNLNDEYFADAMTGELIASLAKLSGLRVISRTSVVRYKGLVRPLPDVARELGVEALVEGGVLLSGDRVRITVELVDARTDETIWAERYERELHDVLGLQAEVAMAIARMIQLELSAPDEALLSRTNPSTSEAYQDYLRGRYHWSKRTREGFVKGIAHLEKAIERDPGYAAAFAGLADCYVGLGVYNFLPHEEVLPRAKRAAENAIAIDDRLAEAHASLGFITFFYEWDWMTSERELRRAIELNPSYATARQWYGIYLVAMGRLDEALKELKRAEKTDPLSLSISENVGWLWYVARDYERAVAQFQDTLELDPNFGQALRYLGLTYLQMGRHREAIESLERASSVLGGATEIRADLALAYTLARTNNGEVQEILNNLRELSTRRQASPFLLGSYFAGIGDQENALAWLETAVEDRSGNLVFLNVEPVFDSVRSAPRFQALARRIGLPTGPVRYPPDDTGAAESSD